ncbi:MAG TPA: formimidoylglutamate deiminase [Solirubrobacterales bacterium]|nr:formimidoylglutamate deiminase [Solirubrobacterales bacterium]
MSADRAGTLWCEFAWLGGERAESGALIELDGDRIDSVTTGIAQPPAQATSLPGLTIAGFANAHSHAFHRALRGRTQAGRGDFWSWRERMYGLAEAVDPNVYLALARATFGEMALAGVTAVGEFHYLHHAPGGQRYEDPNEIGRALIAAAREAGVRITLLDTCYLHGGIDRWVEGTQLRFSDGNAERWAERMDALEPEAGARLGAAIHSVRAVDPESAARVAAFAAERSWPLHAHVSEQPAENDDCRAAYGKSPIGVLADAGALSERFTAVHATHLDVDDFGLLGGRGCSVCLCPTTERDLADGVGPARRLVDAGAKLCLGTDSHAMIDPFEEARAVELNERLESRRRGGHPAHELLRAATAGGYASIGWPEGGGIAPGGLADLVTIGIDGVRLAGAPPDQLIESVVFAAAAADVRHVLVGGEFIVRDGMHRRLDVADELAKAIAMLPA